MNLLNTLVEINTAERLEELQDRTERVAIRGDFEGSVNGYWVRLEQNGVGTVSYNNKQYATFPIGIMSLPQGSIVELSHADGIYFSKF